VKEPFEQKRRCFASADDHGDIKFDAQVDYMRMLP
jgi:hypothetical protein